MPWELMNNHTQKDNVKYWVIFFIFFIIVGSLFILNLFVGVVIDTFNKEKEKLGGSMFLTPMQREWVAMQKMFISSRPKKVYVLSGNKTRDFLLIMTTSYKFEVGIMICIILNTLCLTLKWHRNPKDLETSIEIINYTFAAIFTLEAILKLIGLGKEYFREGWNRFDFFIVIGTFIGIIISESTSVNVGATGTIIRAFRICRGFRLIKRAKSLRKIFNTFVMTLPSLANVGGLLLLLWYIYAILGVFLFATIQLQETLNIHANFQTFGIAFLTLIRVTSGEAWNYILHDCLRKGTDYYYCVSSPSYDQIQDNGGRPNGCGTNSAYLYFISFMLIVAFIFLNLFIAIILQGISI